MSTFSFQAFTSALNDAKPVNGLDFSNKSLKLDSPKDAEEIIKALNECKELTYLELKGNTLGVKAAEAIAKALEKHPEFKQARWSDLFTGRMKTEIPLALSALGQGMIVAKAKLSVLDLSDNAFGPIGVEGLAKLLESEVCAQLQELRLNNNGLGITGGRLLAKALLALAPPLKVFIAGRNRLENEGAKALAEVFKKIGTLEEIAMPQNGIYHVGVTALSIAFKSNVNLRILNLNDNTIGPKGAEAIAEALSSMKGLRDINFGDCLLKGKGARVLAQAFKDNSLQIKNLDLSHNEIDVASSRLVVESITSLPDCRDRLQRVCLAGNGLGNAASKKVLKESLGDAAALSDGEDDDEDDELEFSDGSDSESEQDGSEQEEDIEPSNSNNVTANLSNVTENFSNVTAYSSNVTANLSNVTANLSNVTASSFNVTAKTEDSENVTDDHDITTLAQNFLQVDLDIKEVVVPQDSPVLTFLDKPIKENFDLLGDEPDVVLDEYFQLIVRSQKFVDQYVEGIMKVSGLCQGDEQTDEMKCAKALYRRIFSTTDIRNVSSWQITNSILQTLGLLKREDKLNIQWNLEGCYRVLSSVIQEPYFCEKVRDSIRCFIQRESDRQPIKNRDFDYDKYINVICQ